MRTGVPLLSRFLSKLIEIVGAGLASAAGAFLLGHLATPSSPSPSVVQIVPADADTIRRVRGGEAVVEDLRKDLAGASQPVEVVPVPKVTTATATITAAPVKVDKPAKVAPALSTHHERKAETGTPAPVRITPINHVAQPSIVSQIGEAETSLPAPAQATSEGGFGLFATLRQIPTWLLPNTDRFQSEAPRPPLPVGQFWQSTM